MPRRNNLWANIDWITVLLFLVLVFLGWLNIYASVYNTEHHSIFDLSQRYGKQLMWIGAAFLIGFIILLIETNFYVFFSYIIYGFIVFLLILVLLVGSEINGSKSWFNIGGFGLQPSEFCKFAVSLALAKYMSSFGFKLHRVKSYLTITAIILLPAFFILLQNDTGSALVYLSFILVLFREGLSGIVLFFGTLVVLLFIFALVMSNLILNIALLVVTLIIFFIINPKLKMFGFILLFFTFIYGLIFLLGSIINTNYQPVDFFIVGSLIGSVVSIIYFARKKVKNAVIVFIIFVGAVLFSLTVDFTFNNLLVSHHQSRINELLGIESDPLGTGYNVNQSKIAIGSGGFFGKGYLKGTQTKFDFVPEQSTDFIFCTVGEEWGFVGSFLFIALFLALLIRIVLLAEKQRSGFSRIYGYCVAVILFFHFMVNIGMTIGVMPVIGIPLPFFSYGGSSLWSFTILLFIFIRLDASRLENLS
jgi:rod shape determining protein RodA